VINACVIHAYGTAHYVENYRQHEATLPGLFRGDHFAEVSLSQWLAFTPHTLLWAHLNVDETVPGRYFQAQDPDGSW